MKHLIVALVATLTLGPTTLVAQSEEWKKIPEIIGGSGQGIKNFKKCIGSDVAASQPFFGKGSDQPIDISARKSAARNTFGGKEWTFEGNVRVKQGEVTLTCDKLIILYDEPKGRIMGGGIKSIECLCER